LKNKEMKTRLFILIISLMVLQACQQKNNTTEINNPPPTASNITELTETQYKNAGIETGSVEMRTLSNLLKVNGTIEISPEKQINISAPVGGFVRKIFVGSGSKVTGGMTLATIENQEFIQLQQDYAENASRLEYAETEFKRQTELAQENVSAKKNLELATSEVKTLRSRNLALEQKLLTIGINPASVKQGIITNQISVKSPASGFITAVNINTGKFINPADMLFEVMDISAPMAQLVVYEQDIPKIKLDQKVIISLANEPAKERIAHIISITPKIGEDRTIKVKARLDSANSHIFPKTFLKAFIELDENPVIALPDAAVLTFDNKDYIFVSKGKKGENYEFEMMEIKRGISENNYTEVIFPDNTDTRTLIIVKKGAYNLLAKMKNAGEEE
jgi:cobalt-zinc-cadmium efflux system membrane fusion protein